MYQSDPDILADACWALSYLSDGPNDKIQAVIASGVCRRLVELLMYVNDSWSYLKMCNLCFSHFCIKIVGIHSTVLFLQVLELWETLLLEMTYKHRY